MSTGSVRAIGHTFLYPVAVSIDTNDRYNGSCPSDFGKCRPQYIQFDKAVSSAYDIVIYSCWSLSSGCTPATELQILSGDGGTTYHAGNYTDVFTDYAGSTGATNIYVGYVVDLTWNGTTDPVLSTYSQEFLTKWDLCT